MTVAYSEYLREVLPYARDCPELAAENAIRNAVIEFCDKSHWWLFDHEPITLLPGIADYELDLPDQTELARIQEAWNGQLELREASQDELSRRYVLNWRTQEGDPRYFTRLRPTLITMCPIPQDRVRNAVTMTLALRPTRASTGADDSIYDEWAEVIASGALARLYGTPGQPFFDLETSILRRNMFVQGIGEAKIKRNRGLTRAPTQVRPRSFY